MIGQEGGPGSTHPGSNSANPLEGGAELSLGWAGVSRAFPASEGPKGSFQTLEHRGVLRQWGGGGGTGSETGLEEPQCSCQVSRDRNVSPV